MTASATPPARRVRVLQVVLDLHAGGLERMVADLVRRLDQTRFEIHLLSFGPPGRNAEGLEGLATLHRAPPSGKFAMVWPRALAAQIRRIAPDVVHTHSGVWHKVSLAARLAGVRWLVHTDHGRPFPDPLSARLVDGLAARRTDVVIAVSDALARQLATTVMGKSDRIRVIANGIDTEAFRPAGMRGSIRQELGLDPDRPILGSIGRFDAIKGYDIMLAAFGLLMAHWDTGPTPLLVLAGEGPELPRLRDQAAALGPQAEVRFIGWRKDVTDLLNAFSLFTLASRSEGTSLSLLEAMSCGCCPVVTDVGGNGAVLGPDLAHRMVPASNPQALANAWRDALRDPDRCAADAALARHRVEALFSLDAMVRAYEALYLEGCSSKGLAS